MDPEIERKWQKRWEEARIFEPDIDPERPKFLITVPWPYSNGSLHVGHGRTYSLADVVARYRRIMGFNVLFPMGFHQSGTPILAYSERLRRGDKEAIRQYTDYLREYENDSEIEHYLNQFNEPENIAQYFSDRIVKDFRGLGYSIDWSRRFTSAEPFYQDVVKWQFRRLHDLGLIKQGRYPILYSIEDQNAVGEDDIKDGDTDKVSVEEFTAVIFRGSEFGMVASSLRPETIFGITNLWINPDEEYHIIDYMGERLAVSSGSVQKLILQNPEIKDLGIVEKDRILYHEFTVPITGKKVPVFPSKFVDPENGTGVVYSVPGHSVWDYVALKDLGAGIEPIKIIDFPEGKGLTVVDLVKQKNIMSLSDTESIRDATAILYREEFYSGIMGNGNSDFSGMSVQEARESIKKRLLQESAFILYETSRKAETRGGSKVVVAVLQDQWFIDYSVPWLKEKSHALVNEMLFEPSHYRDGMHDIIDWLRERPCARRRGIGTKLPFDERWTIESLSDSTIYPIVYTCARQLREIHKNLGNNLPEDIIEHIFSGQPLKNSYSDEVMSLISEAARSKEYWYGVDVRMTTSPHITNHLAFYIMNHAALFTERDWPKGIVISGLVISEGAKISKSKGNAISLLKIANNYSSDLYRLFSAINSETTSVLDWNETDINLVRKKYDTFVSMVESFKDPGVTRMGNVERWFVVSFYNHAKDFISRMDKYDIRGACISVFYEVLNDLKHVEARGGNIMVALREVIRDWLVLMSPVIPHTCEELWEKMGNHGFVSAERYISPGSGMDQSPIHRENYIEKLISDIREISRATGIKPSEIRINVAPREIFETTSILMNEGPSKVPDRHKYLIPDFMKNKKNISIEIVDELDLISSEREYLENLFSCRIEIRSEVSRSGRANPWPGRPSIELVR